MPMEAQKRVPICVLLPSHEEANWFAAPRFGSHTDLQPIRTFHSYPLTHKTAQDIASIDSKLAQATRKMQSAIEKSALGGSHFSFSPGQCWPCRVKGRNKDNADTVTSFTFGPYQMLGSAIGEQLSLCTVYDKEDRFTGDRSRCGLSSARGP